MPELQWDETDFVECLGVLPEVEEYGTEFGFTVAREGLVLRVTVRPYESLVEVGLGRLESATDLLSLTFLVTGSISYKREKWGDFLLLPGVRVVSGRDWYLHHGQSVGHGSEPAAQVDLLFIELAIDPDIRLSFV